MPDLGIGELFTALFASGLGEAGAGAGLAEAGAGGIGAGIGIGTGATFADSLIPATLGVGGAIDTGAFDVAGALGGLGGSAAEAGSLAGGIINPLAQLGATAGSTPEGIAGVAAPGVAGSSGVSGIAPAAITPAGAAPGAGLSAGGIAAPASAAPSGGSLFTGAVTSSPASGAIGGGSGLISDAAGGATASLGSPLTSTYGPVSEFATGGSGAVSGAGAAAPSTGSGGIFGSGVSWGDVGSAIKGYGSPAIALGGLGLSALKGNTPMPGQNQISSEAAALAAQGSKLQSYIDNGTLPPGVGQSIKQASDSAKAAIRSRYASMGGDTSAMHQDLANVDQLASGQGATIALQLLNTGINETQLSSALYGQLLNLAVQQNAQLGSAIGTLATSLTPRVLVQGSAA